MSNHFHQPNLDDFTSDEKTLLNIYINEYNDIFSQILSLPLCEFLSNLVKRVEITVNKKFNGFPSASKSKIENYFCEQIYSKEYKIASTAMKSLKKKTSPQIFDGTITEHCLNETKTNGLYVHSCGEPFHIFKYNSTLMQKSNSCTSLKKVFLICLKCEMIYKNSLVKFNCANCKNDFYSKAYTSIDEETDYLNSKPFPYATWKKYHCNAVINETLKCIDCRTSLFFDEKKYVLICSNCDTQINPNNIKWKCIVCTKEFSTEVKAYNPLEFKNMKISVKDTLLNKIKAKPDKITCGCLNIDIDNTKYYHKASCKGELFLGEMNKKKIIVCSKCDALSYYDNFSWTCPFCNKKFKCNNNNNSSGFKNKFIKYDSAKKLQKFKQDEENINNNNNNNNNPNQSMQIGSQRNIPTSNKKKRNMIPTPNKPKSGVKCIESSRSPYMILKQNLAARFSGIEIDDSIKNFGHVIAPNDKEDNFLLSKLLNGGNENNNNHNSNKKHNKHSSGIVINSNASSYSTASSNQGTNDANKNSNTIETTTNESTLYIPNYNFEVNDYLVKKQIGEGSFGKIYLVESKTKQLFALKKIVGTSHKEIQSLKHEYEILLSLQRCENNMNLVTIHGIQTKQLDQTTYVMYVLMDLANADWEKEILTRQKSRKYYTEIELFTILKSLVKTFAELQRKSISHRDIKPQNILVFHEEHQFKIADFGEAKELLRNARITNKQTLRGTELYMSPILFNALRDRKCNVKYIEHNTYKSDVFSFGLCALFAAALCFEALYDVRELKDMGSIKIVLDNYLRNRYSGKLIDILLQMLEVNEKNRCDFVELEKVFNNTYY